MPSPATTRSTLIISVYDDCSALQLILDSLGRQSTDGFEIIISEDGRSDEIKQCIRDHDNPALDITHLSQEDLGFRKNIALNRAILASNTDHVIFIDGDCVPHTGFIAAHQSRSGSGITCTGRRLELGPLFSKRLRDGNISLNQLTNRLYYFLNIYSLLQDKAKNIESGIYSKLLQSMISDREIRLLGCNFSCNKEDLFNINGFNEDYLSPGIGEDSDIDWRLIHSGVIIKNVKFSAIQYHLHHPRSYMASEENTALFEETKRSDTFTCDHGINKIRN